MNILNKLFSTIKPSGIDAALNDMLKAIAAHHDAIIAHINSLPDSIKGELIKEIATMAVNDIAEHEGLMGSSNVSATVVASPEVTS
jgi:hypothetical protein